MSNSFFETPCISPWSQLSGSSGLNLSGRLVYVLNLSLFPQLFSQVDDAAPSNMDRKSPPLQAAPNEYLVKYFGCVEVELGTGIETVQKSVEVLFALT